jgi:hypothetical protein
MTQPTMDTWTPPADLDPECAALCAAINDCVPGVVTRSSCCGHGSQPYRIWIQPSSLNALLPLLWKLDVCHSGIRGWQVIVYTDCSAQAPIFRIEGPVGAYAESGKLAEFIREDDEDDDEDEDEEYDEDEDVPQTGNDG